MVQTCFLRVFTDTASCKINKVVNFWKKFTCIVFLYPPPLSGVQNYTYIRLFAVIPPDRIEALFIFFSPAFFPLISFGIDFIAMSSSSLIISSVVSNLLIQSSMFSVLGIYFCLSVRWIWVSYLPFLFSSFSYFLIIFETMEYIYNSCLNILVY